MIHAGKLRDLVRIEAPVADDSLDGAGSGTWQLLTSVWAEVQDVLPSRAERLADGLNVASRPSRIRMRYREDVTAAMRFIVRGRIMQIVAGPAVLGNREGLEFMAEDYTSAGSGA